MDEQRNEIRVTGNRPGGRRHRAGVAIYLYCFGAIALFGLIGLAVDVSLAYHEKSRLQCAADAAAMAGSLGLIKGQQTTEAARFLNYNSVEQSEIVTIQFLNSIPGDGPGIKVTLRRDVPTFFLKVLGRFTLPVAATASARNSSTSATGVCSDEGSCFGYSMFVLDTLRYNGNSAMILHDVAIGTHDPTYNTTIGTFILGDGVGSRGTNNHFYGAIDVKKDFTVNANGNVADGEVEVGGTYTPNAPSQQLVYPPPLGTTPEIPALPTLNPTKAEMIELSKPANYFDWDPGQNRWENELGSPATAPPGASFSGNTIKWDQNNLFINNETFYIKDGNVQWENFDGATGGATIYTTGTITFTKSNQKMDDEAAYNFITDSTSAEAIKFIGNFNEYSGVMHATSGTILEEGNQNVINGAMIAKNITMSKDANNFQIGSICANTAILNGTQTVCYHVHLVE